MNESDERSRGIGDAALILRWIRANSLKSFTLRECQQRLRGRFRKAAQLEPVIEILVEQGIAVKVGTRIAVIRVAGEAAAGVQAPAAEPALPTAAVISELAKYRGM